MDIQSSITFWSFIKTVLKPFRWFLGGQLIVAIIWAISECLRPYIFKQIINDLSLPHSSHNLKSLMLVISSYWILNLIFFLNFRFYDWIVLKTKPFIKESIMKLLTDKAMAHSHEFYLQQFTGNLTNKINDVASNVPSLINIIIDSFLAQGLAILMAVYTVWQVEIKFAIAMVIWSLFYLLSAYFLAKKGRTLAFKAANVRSKIVGYMADILSNIMNVRLFGNRGYERQYFGQALQEFIKAEQTRHKFSLKMHTIQGFSFIIFQGICIYFLMQGFLNNTITPGDFALILTINANIIDCLWNVSKDFTNFNEEYGQVTQGLGIISIPPSIKDAPKAKPLKISHGNIHFHHVDFQYPNSTPIYKDFSLHIAAHQRVGLVGYSGSGKTTYISLLLRLFNISKGKISIDGQDVAKVTQESLRQSISVIPQDSILFHRTLLENIRYGKLNATKEEIIEAAKKANAHEFIMQSANGYETMVGERGIKLSGGQRQRISIARAFLKNAPILILDEATNQLDSLTEHYIQESLGLLMKGKTTIVIAHRLSTLLQMDRILVMSQGKIVQDGSHNQLVNQSGIYKSLWDTQTSTGEITQKANFF